MLLLYIVIEEYQPGSRNNEAASEIIDGSLLMHIFTYFVPSIAINMLLLRERIPHKYANVIPETLQCVCVGKKLSSTC